MIIYSVRCIFLRELRKNVFIFDTKYFYLHGRRLHILTPVTTRPVILMRTVLIDQNILCRYGKVREKALRGYESGILSILMCFVLF